MKKHFRIVALQNNFRSREATAKVIDTWADLGFDTEQLFHVCGDHYTSIYDPEQHHDLMRDYIAKAQANGIGILLYLNCHILCPQDADKAPQWATRQPDGSYSMLYGTYYGMCLRSSWKEHFFATIRTLAEFPLQGLFFDGPLWGGKCACPSCRKEFQEHYGKPFDDGTEAEHDEFDRWSVETFKRELCQVCRQTNPEWLIYFNEGLMSGRFNAEDMHRQINYNNLVGTEYGGFFGHAPNYEMQHYWRTAEGAKIAKAVAGDKPTVIFFAGDHKPWNWYMHTPAATRLTYASVLANGGSVWYGLHNDPDYLAGEYGEAIREMVAFDRQWDGLYSDFHSQAEAAVFYSFDTAYATSHTGMATDLYNDEDRRTTHPGNYSTALVGAEALLEATATPWDFVTELNLEKLPQYKMVLVPAMAMVNDKTADALEAYVRSGGTIVADGEFGFFDQTGRRRETTLLERLVGIRPATTVDDYSGYFFRAHYNYFAFDERFYGPDQTLRLLPLPEYLLPLEQTGSAEVIARACTVRPGPYEAKPDQPHRPVGLEQTLGKGRILYLAGGFFQMYFPFRMVDCRKCFANFQKSIYTPKFQLKGSLPGVSMTVSAGHLGTAVHLTNYISIVWPIEKVAPQNGITLCAPKCFTKAKALRNGQQLKQNSQGDWLLPHLTEFETILLNP